MRTHRIVVTVGVSASRVLGPYIERWRRTFAEFSGSDGVAWDRDWPPGSPSHHEVHYAFKVHAMFEAARRGYTSILWCDAACYAIKPLDKMWARLERDGHVLIDDANKLGTWSSDKSLATFGMSRDQAMTIPLMCGTCWGVDLRVEKSRTFLERLRSYATGEHFCGSHQSRSGIYTHPRPGTEGALFSSDERCWGHRSDEVYMSLLAHELGMATHAGVEFCGGMTVQEDSCIRSGYDIPGAPT